ncbi:MAG: hypothetical protein KF754_02210 [Planctomycetes bacterium]|nr:hypothetical protein [Planctomycetota bacterium]
MQNLKAALFGILVFSGGIAVGSAHQSAAAQESSKAGRGCHVTSSEHGMIIYYWDLDANTVTTYATGDKEYSTIKLQPKKD